MNPHIILLCICESDEDRSREVPPVVVTVSEVLLRAYIETHCSWKVKIALIKSLSASALFVFPFKDSYIT